MTALLLLMVLFWGANYAVVKMIVAEVPPAAFNSVRLVIASTVFLLLMAASTLVRRQAPGIKAAIADRTPGGERNLAFLRTATRPTGRDWLQLALLGVVGQFLYQALFADGVAKTSVANAALIIGCTPMVVSLASAGLGLERLGRQHWLGIAVSMVGMYLVVGLGAKLSGASAAGDAMMLGCVLCWTVYTLAGQPILRRHSPLMVTGWSMTFGTLLYLPYQWPILREVAWSAIPRHIWVWTTLSALLALNVSYVIWYAAVQRLGSARTSLYSNLVPVAALVVAALWLGERLGPAKLVGALLVIGGLLTTRIKRPAIAPPPEE